MQTPITTWITASVNAAHKMPALPHFGSTLPNAASRVPPMKLMKKPRPKRPKTMDGTPARLLMAPRMIRVALEVACAYSVR